MKRIATKKILIFPDIKTRADDILRKIFAINSDFKGEKKQRKEKIEKTLKEELSLFRALLEKYGFEEAKLPDKEIYQKIIKKSLLEITR